MWYDVIDTVFAVFREDLITILYPMLTGVVMHLCRHHWGSQHDYLAYFCTVPLLLVALIFTPGVMFAQSERNMPPVDYAVAYVYIWVAFGCANCLSLLRYGKGHARRVGLALLPIFVMHFCCLFIGHAWKLWKM